MALGAHAGRPLATDDASVNEAGGCELEAWGERSRDERAQVLALGCGLGAGFDVGIDVTRLRPRNSAIAQAGGGLKWAPERLKIDIGEAHVAFATSLGFVTTRPVASGWQLSGVGARALMSVEADAFALHLNLGPQRDRDAHRTASLLDVAMTWSPLQHALLFAEWQTNDRRGAIGNTLRTLGGRWWLSTDKWALDLTRSHANGGGASSWSVGLGWYGLGH